MNVVQFGVAIIAGCILIRLFSLQIISGSYYQALASNQYDFYEELVPERGEILVRDLKDGQLYPAATNLHLGWVIADPKNVEDPDGEAEILGEILGLSGEEIDALELRFEDKTDRYESVARKVPQAALALIDEAKRNKQLPGITYVREPSRSYPETSLGGHVLGFVGVNEDGSLSGRYGIEGYFEEELSGTGGFLASERDAAGRLITSGEREFQPAVDGADIVLTLDRNIQHTVCDLLEKAVAKHSADGGSVVVLDPKTGAVLAMCGSPDFDPNAYSRVENIRVYNNPVIFNAYEPGSIMKPLTIAASIDAGAITPTTEFEDFGFVEMDDFTIRNSEDKVYGKVNMVKVLEESINTGVIFAMQQMGSDLFDTYMRNFGFGVYTGIELETESAGDVSSLDRSAEVYDATASFGQGVTTTVLQMAQAYAALANGGHVMQPYIVDEVRYADGRVRDVEPIEVRQVISEKTSNLISAMLISVVENGHGKKAAVEGYYIAGKTGTAQVAGASGTYLADATIGSFAGYGPVGDPRFAIVVRIDRPRDVQWAESTAGPLFGDIAAFLLRYFEVPPQR